MATYYLTKYALSVGIEKREIDREPEVTGRVYDRNNFSQSFKIGVDAFHNRSSAVAAAKAARDKKVSSLKKQISKLEKMTFDEAPE